MGVWKFDGSRTERTGMLSVSSKNGSVSGARCLRVGLSKLRVPSSHSFCVPRLSIVASFVQFGSIEQYFVLSITAWPMVRERRHLRLLD